MLQPLKFSLRQRVGLPALLDGQYVGHDSPKEHFFALKIVEGILAKLDGDMVQDLSLSDGRQMLQDPRPFFHLFSSPATHKGAFSFASCNW